MHTPRTVHRVQQPRHRSCSVSASTSAPLPREYALQEPRAEGRAIDPAAVERMFDATLGAHISPREFEQIWRGPPDPPADRAWPDPAGAWYCTGIHWAQQRDDTVAVRCETTPLQVVAVDRIQRRPWPEMAAHVGALLDAFPGPAAHDTTGAGNAIGEFPALAAHNQLQGVTLVGRVRMADRPVPARHWGHRTARDRLSSDRRVLSRAPVLRGRRSVRERAFPRDPRRPGPGLSRLPDRPATD